MTRVYRKIGKAHWEFKCPMCKAVVRSVDEFGVYEAQWKHHRAHSDAVGQIVKVFTDAFAPLLNSVKGAFEMFSKAFSESTPTNTKYPTSENPNQQRRKR